MTEIQEKANTIPQELSIAEIRKYTKEAAPLIHCITNPISIHDCANIILAAGARPIMAEHPAEVAEITAVASALMLNLGNITDARIESIQRALKEANRRKIPVLLDLVGVTCSSLRREFARKLLTDGRFAVIKGNISEILAAADLPFHGTESMPVPRMRYHRRMRQATALPPKSLQSIWGVRSWLPENWI